MAEFHKSGSKEPFFMEMARHRRANKPQSVLFSRHYFKGGTRRAEMFHVKPRRRDAALQKGKMWGSGADSDKKTARPVGRASKRGKSCGVRGGPAGDMDGEQDGVVGVLPRHWALTPSDRIRSSPREGVQEQADILYNKGGAALFPAWVGGEEDSTRASV